MSSTDGGTDAGLMLGASCPRSSICCPGERQAAPAARPASLSRRQIIQAAIELADAEGPEAISMRRIATRLRIGAMTLYGYVADRDALIAHMINEVAAEIRPPRPAVGQLAC